MAEAASFVSGLEALQLPGRRPGSVRRRLGRIHHCDCRLVTDEDMNLNAGGRGQRSRLQSRSRRTINPAWLCPWYCVVQVRCTQYTHSTTTHITDALIRARPLRLASPRLAPPRPAVIGFITHVLFNGRRSPPCAFDMRA